MDQHVDAEYKMLRAELETLMKRRFDLNFLFYGSLGLAIVANVLTFQTTLISSFILLFFLMITIPIQMQIIDCRNAVYCLSAYMIVCLEPQSKLYKWETNRHAYSKEFKNRYQKPMQIYFRVVKNSGILLFVSLNTVTIYLNLLKDSENAIYHQVILILALLISIVTCVFTFKTSNDGKKRDVYIGRWSIIYRKLNGEKKQHED